VFKLSSARPWNIAFCQSPQFKRVVVGFHQMQAASAVSVDASRDAGGVVQDGDIARLVDVPFRYCQMSTGVLHRLDGSSTSGSAQLKAHD